MEEKNNDAEIIEEFKSRGYTESGAKKALRRIKRGMKDLKKGNVKKRNF